MAVREKVDSTKAVAKLEPNEEVRTNPLVTIVMRERVTKEWLKGILASAAAIAGAFLATWDSKTEDFAYWFMHISGSIVFFVGLAYAVEFIKLLISGDLPKATSSLMKGFEMKEWMKVFLAFVSIGAGICFLLNNRELAYYLPRWIPHGGDCIGIILIAAGIAYFWTQSKFYKG
jgi:hypothetical protein